MNSFRQAAFSLAISGSRAGRASTAMPTLRISSLAKLIATPTVPRAFSTTRVAERPDQAEDTSVKSAQSLGSTRSAEGYRADLRPAGSGQQRGPEEEPKNGIFVRNLVFDATEQHLSEGFEKYGKIVKSLVVRDVRGLSRGFGFVWFEKPDSAERAVTNANGTFWHGRRISCQHRLPNDRRLGDRGEPLNTPSRTIFIGNIPYETTDVELNHLFRDLEMMVDARISVDRVTGWPRGFAHADFFSIEAAQNAIKRLKGARLGERDLRLDFALESPELEAKLRRYAEHNGLTHA